MTAHEPPDWLVDRARATARQLHDAGQPVTPEAVAERVTFSFNESLALVRRALLDAARAALGDDAQ